MRETIPKTSLDRTLQSRENACFVYALKFSTSIHKMFHNLHYKINEDKNRRKSYIGPSHFSCVVGGGGQGGSWR